MFRSSVTAIATFLVTVIFCTGCSTSKNEQATIKAKNNWDIRVSENKRFLVKADDSPFFYLGDTCWEMFHRMTREDAELYLANRASKGFTVIQAVALAELEGLNTPNRYGDKPLIDNDPKAPDVTEGTDQSDSTAYDYWDHVDWIIKNAASKGIYIGLVPTWGDKVFKKWGVGPEIFNAENARFYGEWIGNRYKDYGNIIWIMGGDRAPEEGNLDYKPVYRAMAEGIKAVDSRHLMTYHSWGGTSSSDWFHNDSWLDFSMHQSGHGARNAANYKRVADDMARNPSKPVFDGEPCYEDIPVNFLPENGWFNAFDVRKAAYRSLLAGAFGHTYGTNNVWQLWEPGRTPIIFARTPWQESLDLPGAFHMRYVRALMESRPMLIRIPDQSLIKEGQVEGALYVSAARGEDGSYAFIYTPEGKPVNVDLTKLSGDKIKASWFMPVNGSTVDAGEFPREGSQEFKPPYAGSENDWVLILDDVSKGYKAPSVERGFR